MLDLTPSPLQRLLRERRPGYSLAAPFYTSPDVFAADLEAIFGRHWIYVGVEPDVPEAGDVMVVEIGAASVAVVRDDEGEIRAFHNVCRHRGAKLVHDGKSTVGKLVCRYHSWTYDLAGALIHAEHMGPGFDRACHGLKAVHVRSLEGLLFVCLAEEPPADFDAMAARVGPYLAPHDVRGTKVAFQSDIVEPGNWKLTMENNRECYHCGTNHPELTVPLFAYGFGFSPEDMDETDQENATRYACMLSQRHGEWEADGLPSREIDELDTMITGFRTERLPLDGAGESHTLDTRAACRKLLGDLTNAKLGGLSFWTQPNSWHHFMGDHIVTFAVFPLDAERSLLRTKWLVHKDAVEGVDYDLDNLTGVWLATNDQDSALVGYCQDGARQPAYEPGPYSPHTEMLVEKFVDWYVGRMAAHHGQPAGTLRTAERTRRIDAVATNARLDVDPVAAPVRSFTVEFATTGRAIQVHEDQTVLAAARIAGIPIPSSCGRGLCGTCKSQILSGTVEMKHRGGIRQREIDAGLALLCCSKPTSDLVVER